MLLCIFLVLSNYGIISIKIVWKEVHVERVVELQISYKFNHSFLNVSLKYLARYISRCIILYFLISLLLRKKDNFTMRNRYKKKNEVFLKYFLVEKLQLLRILYTIYTIYYILYIYIYILILYFFIKNYVLHVSQEG